MKILISEMNWPQGINLFKETGDVEYDPELWQDRDLLYQKIKDTDALIVRNQTQVNKELLEKASRLKVVGRLGVGLDNIDLEECKKRDIQIVYARNANAISVAEYVMTAILLLNRKLVEANQDVKKGGWNRRLFTGTEIYGKTLGLIGAGEIAHRVARRALSFNMNVLSFDPFVTEYDFPMAETGVVLTSFDKVIQESDYISIHVPLLASTRHMFGKKQFEQMKTTSCIINTSRGGIIHEEELAEALIQDKIGAAVLDVLEQEPPNQAHPLLHNEKVILTPHVAGLTEESQVRTSYLVAEEVIKVLTGKKPLYAV